MWPVSTNDGIDSHVFIHRPPISHRNLYKLINSTNYANVNTEANDPRNVSITVSSLFQMRGQPTATAVPGVRHLPTAASKVSQIANRFQPTDAPVTARPMDPPSAQKRAPIITRKPETGVRHSFPVAGYKKEPTRPKSNLHRTESHQERFHSAR